MNQETKSCMGNFQCAKVERTGQVNLISPENVKMIKHVLSSGRLMHGSSFSQGRNMGIPSWARFLKRKQG
jgi:hypothetical protein